MLLETPDLILEQEDEGIPYEGVPIGASGRQMGSANTYRVLGLSPREVELVIYDVRWITGERDVVAPAREVGNHPKFDGIVGRHRLGIQRVGGITYMVLAQTRLDGSNRPPRAYPGLNELQTGAGVPFEATLLAHGATEVGSRGDLLGEEGPQQRRPIVTFDDRQAPHLPAVVFALTRVAPLARGVTA